MNTCGICHVFIDNFCQTKRRRDGIHIQRLAKRFDQRCFRICNRKAHRPAGEIVGVKLSKHQISIGDRRTHTAATIACGARFRTCAFRTDPDLP